MERHFGIPVAFAAAAHAALLFAFPSSPPTVKPTRTTIVVDVGPTPPPPEPDTPPEVAETKTGKPLDTPEIAPPRLPEPPSIETVAIFTQPVPPLQPFDPNQVVNVAPVTLAGERGLGSQIGSVVSSVYLDNQPRTRFQVAPAYPFQAKTNGQNGEVMVEFVVDEAGNVLDPRVVSSSDRSFEENTLRAVAKWKFEPGRRDGRVVRFRMSVPVVFKLNE